MGVHHFARDMGGLDTPLEMDVKRAMLDDWWDGNPEISPVSRASRKSGDASH